VNQKFSTPRDKMKSDHKTTVEELRTVVQKFVEERDWQQYHNPKSLAMSIAIEAAEIMEQFQWLSLEESLIKMSDSEKRQAVIDEMADVLIYCFALANKIDADISEAVRTKLSSSEGRYPIGHMPT
jgi:NTP pyrophosphatase (non-canonical NTP hydrolase)